MCKLKVSQGYRQKVVRFAGEMSSMSLVRLNLKYEISESESVIWYRVGVES